MPPELIILILNFFKALSNETKFSLFETDIKAFLTLNSLLNFFISQLKILFLLTKLPLIVIQTLSIIFLAPKKILFSISKFSSLIVKIRDLFLEI